ncbi:hypothetical protein B0H10DRAFT_424018 [Mycena sp. CBHHK59/15]|nr:hypothetical protein B0H10DRAFT_424018 [Mycena sp. CBHHK59/15]
MICGRVAFPSLRALNMQPSEGLRHNRILGFVCDHPTLREVNIPRMYLNFPDFLQLVKGERCRGWDVHAPMQDDSGESASNLSDPASDMWTLVELGGFAFVRTTEQSNLELPDGSTPPSHIVTELSMESSCYNVPFVLSTFGDLGSLPPFTECTRLSLTINDSQEHPLWGDPILNYVPSMMRDLRNSLAKWKHLRYFSLAGYSANPPLWRWEIHRDAVGAVRLVSGHLTWNGHINHPPTFLGDQFEKHKT